MNYAYNYDYTSKRTHLIVIRPRIRTLLQLIRILYIVNFYLPRDALYQSTRDHAKPIKPVGHNRVDALPAVVIPSSRSN